MQKHLLYIPLIALSSALALTACSDEVTNTLTPDLPIGEKTPIELSVGGVDSPNAATRAVITDGTGKTMEEAFDINTKIFMIMKSEFSSFSSPYEYLNYGGSSDSKYTVSRGDIYVGDGKDGKTVEFDATNKKYWDDAHARSSKLSIWAYAQKGQNWTTCSFAVDKAGGGYESHPYQTAERIAWGTTPIYPMIFNWKASHLEGSDVNKQNGMTVVCQDLLFSNNLVNNSSSGTNLGGSDSRLSFNPSTRKFPQVGEAEMKFYHAMSKITIRIIEGDGFDKSSTSDFQFKSGTNVKLTDFNTEGLFSIQQGIFQQINGHEVIPSIYLKSTQTTDDPYYTLEALAVPNIDEFMQTYDTPLHDDYSRFLEAGTNVMMEFTIDNNTYQITSGALYNALHVDGDPQNDLVTNAVEKNNNGTYIPLEAGKHYVFTFKIGKTQIKNLTACVVGWEEVIAEDQYPSNARIKLNLEERGTHIENSEKAAIYRSSDDAAQITDTWVSYNWDKGYLGHQNTFEYNSTTTSWGLANNWYWENSMNYYHFRALMPSNTSIVEEKDASDKVVSEYVALTHAETDYTDILWGAPMTDYAQNEVSDAANLKWSYGPTTNGFDGLDTKDTDAHQIYQAIGPTKDAIKLILFHMMSDVTFNVKTSAVGELDRVDLGNGTSGNATTIELQKIHKEGNLYMGNGLVKGSDAVCDYPFTTTPAPDGGVITWPHYGAIPQSLENVVLVITTPDHNQYKVAMKEVLAESISNYNLANPYKKKVGDKYKIDRWYPGFKYIYTFTLSKTGITDLQATIVDWETVTADEQEVVIQ